MFVSDYIETRKGKYGKRIRVLDYCTRRNLGHWWENSYKKVVAIKVTEKYLFIFV